MTLNLIALISLAVTAVVMAYAVASIEQVRSYVVRRKLTDA